MAETQVVTAVFTDLVGSTALSSRLDAEVADELRGTHFALLRSAIEAHGGQEVKNLGDGLMVVFSITSGALNCAEAMQQAIELHNKRAAESLSIRIGLSLGEVTEEDGDYFGDAVVEAARLCAAAEGDQILATQLVQLTAGRRARQQFAPMGDLELKGLPQPVATVEVRWAPADASGVVPLPERCLVSSTVGFVGRESERSMLHDAVRRVAREDRHQLVMIGGEPGIGKTALASQCVQSAHKDGAIVLYGRAEEDLGVPYGPWNEALTHLVSHAPPSLIESLGPYAGSLVRLAPALTGQFGASDSVVTSDPEAARHILFSAVTSALRTAGELATVVVILDDLQWADAPSLQLLRHVAAASEPMRLLLIGTFRESDVAAAGPLADLLAALHREPAASRVSLLGLDELELLAMMEGAAGQQIDEDGLSLRDELMAETDGNPFFVGELLRHLTETGGIYQEDGRWVSSSDLRSQGLPVSVREVIARRVERLGEPGTRVLATASVIGRDFDLSLLAAASELDEDTLLDVMDRAAEATLIENVDGNRCTFVHALIEYTLYESLAPARRARLHRRIAEAIEAQCRGRTQGRVGELAYHWAEAVVPEELDKAMGYARAAGDEALARLAPAEALRRYSQALSLLEQRQVEAKGMRAELLLGLGVAQRQTGDAAYRETLLDVAHLAQDLGATELLAAAALANNRGFFSVAGVVDAERVAVLEAASDAMKGTESADRARLLALLASELTYGADLARRRDLMHQAVTMARNIGDPATLVDVINQTSPATTDPETLGELLSLTAEGFEAARSIGDPVLQFWSALQRCFACYQAGIVIEADEALSVARRVAERLGQPIIRMHVTFVMATRAMLAGDLDEAERLSIEAVELGSSTGQPDIAAFFAGQFGVIRVMQGRGAEIVELVRQATAENPGIPAFATFLAGIYCDLDRPEEARAVLEPFVADGFPSIPRDLIWLITMSNIAYAVAELGWTDAAGPVLERLSPFIGQICCIETTTYPEVGYYLGLLAATLDRFEEAEAYFSQAAATHERIGAAWALAKTQLGWGSMLSARGERGDRDRASALLEQALASAQARGYALVARRALQALESVGVGLS
jgi:class 3 adenylate cyclase/tetratricopeptide (TPR) repeat protein